MKVGTHRKSLLSVVAQNGNITVVMYIVNYVFLLFPSEHEHQLQPHIKIIEKLCLHLFLPV